MRSVTPMRAAKTGYIIMSVLLCVLGVVLFVWPGVSVAVIGELLGIGMIVFGAVKVAGYLSRDLFRLAFQYDLAFGVLLIALGIVTLTHPGETIGFLCVVYGILVLSDGLLRCRSPWTPNASASTAGGPSCWRRRAPVCWACCWCCGPARGRRR